MWTLFATSTLASAAYFGYRLVEGDRRFVVPGAMTKGHYPIESECNLCHTPMMGVKADACMECHAAELERIDDSHPPSKFSDPRNADRLAKLDARSCIACHVEHRPELTRAMGVTQPRDHCQNCHADIAKERPTHTGLGFASCQDAGCHNFHDNVALHEDYLERHLDDPELLSAPVSHETRAMRALSRATSGLRAEQHDAPAGHEPAPALLAAFIGSGHARAAVNCTGCHAPAGAAWSDHPTHAVCGECHAAELSGFLGSKHGMRLAAGLAPMTPAQARLPMHASAGHIELGCQSCHGAHDYDRARAAVEACLTCHADQHSLAYRASKHHALWQAEREGRAPAGSGVSCATCHLPRIAESAGEVARVAHNQNDYLRPNEKMIDAVCARCHGVGFALDALADPQVIARGVEGRPRTKVASMDMVRKKLAALAGEGTTP